MARSDRLFELIQILRRSKRPVTARVLAERLEVTERTIYRDVAALQAMRVPVEGAAGVGYLMRGGFDLPPLMFDAEEVEALTVGLALLARTGDAGLVAAAECAAAKLADVVPRAVAQRLDPAWFQVSAFGIARPAQADLRLLRRAVHESRAIDIRYCDAAGATTQRRVKPIAVLYYIEVAVLAAWCELRGDFRHFRVDRMAQVTLAETGFAAEAPRLRRQWLALARAAQGTG